MRFFHLSPFLVLLAASAGAGGAPQDLRIESKRLIVQLKREDATLIVTDKRAGRIYRQLVPAGDPAWRVVEADRSGRTKTRTAEATRIVAVVQGPIEAVWTIGVGDEEGDLHSTLAAPPDRPFNGELLFPHPFEVEQKRDWQARDRQFRRRALYRRGRAHSGGPIIPGFRAVTLVRYRVSNYSTYLSYGWIANNPSRSLRATCQSRRRSKLAHVGIGAVPANVGTHCRRT